MLYWLEQEVLNEMHFHLKSRRYGYIVAVILKRRKYILQSFQRKQKTAFFPKKILVSSKILFSFRLNMVCKMFIAISKRYKVYDKKYLLSFNANSKCYDQSLKLKCFNMILLISTMHYLYNNRYYTISYILSSSSIFIWYRIEWHRMYLLHFSKNVNIILLQHVDFES